MIQHQNYLISKNSAAKGNEDISYCDLGPENATFLIDYM